MSPPTTRLLVALCAVVGPLAACSDDKRPEAPAEGTEPSAVTTVAPGEPGNTLVLDDPTGQLPPGGEERNPEPGLSVQDGDDGAGGGG